MDNNTRNNELNEEEVNVYGDCGEILAHCLNDCIGGGAWLSIEY